MWFAIMTKPQFERKALHSLERMSIHAQCPYVVERRVRHYRTKDVDEETRAPLFPGYIFVEMDFIPHWFANEDWYVMALPRKSEPRPIAADLIENALAMSGTITVNEWKTVQRFHRGDVVRHKASGATVIIDEVRGKKLIALLDLLGKQHRVELQSDQVEAAE